MDQYSGGHYKLGLTDAEIHDLVQVIAYFNYINRVADALGVDLETQVRAWEQGPSRRN